MNYKLQFNVVNSDSGTKRIHNQILSPSLIERAIKSLIDLPTYSDWMSFKSPTGDGLVISLNREDETITISVSEEHDMDFEIQAKPKVIDQFIKEMTAEVAAIAATELTQCLTEKKDSDELKSLFRKKLLDAIIDAFEGEDIPPTDLII